MHPKEDNKEKNNKFSEKNAVVNKYWNFFVKLFSTHRQEENGYCLQLVLNYLKFIINKHKVAKDTHVHIHSIKQHIENSASSNILKVCIRPSGPCMNFIPVSLALSYNI